MTEAAPATPRGAPGIPGVLLAGGLARRMGGGDKPMRAIGGKTILQRVIARGRVYLSNASINGHFALRACFVNHRTEPEDVHEIVSEVIAAAAEMNA